MEPVGGNLPGRAAAREGNGEDGTRHGAGGEADKGLADHLVSFD